MIWSSSCGLSLCLGYVDTCDNLWEVGVVLILVRMDSIGGVSSCGRSSDIIFRFTAMITPPREGSEGSVRRSFLCMS